MLTNCDEGWKRQAKLGKRGWEEAPTLEKNLFEPKEQLHQLILNHCSTQMLISTQENFWLPVLQAGQLSVVLNDIYKMGLK